MSKLIIFFKHIFIKITDINKRRLPKPIIYAMIFG